MRKIAVVLIVSMMIGVGFLSGCTTPNNNNWWNNEWHYRKQITIDHTKVADNLINFPILITQTLDTTKVQSDADDIVFTTNNQIKLNHEIETFNSSNGNLVAWVNITTLRSDIDTVLYMYYGNPTCSNQQNGMGTWNSNYKAVWHMKDETSTTIGDSTSNNYDGTKQETSHPNQVSGIIGVAELFDGAVDYTIHGDIFDIYMAGSNANFSISGWIKLTKASKQNNIFSKNGDSNQGENQREFSYSVSPANRLEVITQYSLLEGNYKLYTGNITTFSTTTWYYITITYNASLTENERVKMYVGNSLETSTITTVGAGTGYMQNGTAQVSLGAQYGTSGPTAPSTSYFNGTMDEFRFYNGVKDTNIITTEYNNQNSPSTFFSVGLEGQK